MSGSGGSPSRDPKKNGCPSLVVVSDGKLQILAPVFFATNKDVILAKSTPVLTAVSEALKASPEIKKLMVEGHTDDRGKSAYNRDLSDRRARSVVKWLIGQAVLPKTGYSRRDTARIVLSQIIKQPRVGKRTAV